VAKLNMIIRAFDAAELRALCLVIEQGEISATEDGLVLPEFFQDLKETIERASKYVNGQARVA
jgi:hypothetical protein